MNQSTPATNKTSENRIRRSSAVILWTTVFVTYLWMVLTMSMSGRTSWISSIGIFPAFAFACYTFFSVPRKRILEQLLGALAFALIVLMLIKNIADIYNPSRG